MKIKINTALFFHQNFQDVVCCADVTHFA